MGRQDGAIRSSTGMGLRRLAMAAAATVLSVTFSACTPQYRYHGYIPSESELAAVVVGQDTRETVVAAIGAPTTSGLLSDTDFYYVQSQFRDYGWRESREINRQVLTVSFNEGGVVTNIERFGLEDGNVIALSRRVTDDNLRDTTFIRQLLGNVGNLDAGQFLGGGDE